MAGSMFDSPLFARLFPTGAVGGLFTDNSRIRAMLLVEGMLASAQGELRVIPPDSARVIARAAQEVQIDPAVLADRTGGDGVCVPALVAEFRRQIQAPEHARYVHWGATSQDIIDTATMLCLRQALALIESEIAAALRHLAGLAREHADLAMVARTYGQHATPTSFGAVVATWGEPLLALLDELPGLRRECLLVSLSGAAGTGTALGADPVALRAELSRQSGLGDPGRGWHTDRTPVLRLADWLERVALANGKIGTDLALLGQSGIDEVSLRDAGASSTMPQKRNPVAPSALVALAGFVAGLAGTLRSNAAIHAHQRDGAAWFTEWLSLPQIVLAAAASATIAGPLCAGIRPRPGAMQAALDGGLGLINAEALSFALSASMPRPDAQTATGALCREALADNVPLRDLVARDWPDLDLEALFEAPERTGTAPMDARAFAARVTARQLRAV